MVLYDGIKIIFCSVINMDIIIIAGFYGWITASFYLKDCSVTAFIVVLYNKYTYHVEKAHILLYELFCDASLISILFFF